MDRRLVISVCAAVAALAAGVAAAVVDAPVLGIVAGIAGIVSGVAAAALAVRLRSSEDQLVSVGKDLQRLRRELDTLAAIFAEEATRRQADDAAAAGASAANPAADVFDAVSGLLDERFFAVTVQQRVAAARRQLQPVSVVLFELDGLDGAGDEARDQAVAVLGDVVRRTLRECDVVCRLGEVLAGVVLEDTAEAGAVWAAERVRGTLHASAAGGTLTISAGIACYPSHALGAAELVAMAGNALGSARARGRDHVEVAQAE
ncbi:MAG TPA: GGDEF domain-containing protein [Acidimicrobiia bacterium]|nr:GGDEF domain-containing protein [Acidimicrobiia bacterium]